MIFRGILSQNQDIGSKLKSCMPTRQGPLIGAGPIWIATCGWLYFCNAKDAHGVHVSKIFRRPGIEQLRKMLESFSHTSIFG